MNAEELKMLTKEERKSLAQMKMRDAFSRLADVWERETRNLSSPVAITSHNAHKKIVKMGTSALPFIFARMRRSPGFWFEALLEIAKPKADPVPDAMRGDMFRMTDAWLKWGEKHGYVSSR